MANRYRCDAHHISTDIPSEFILVAFNNRARCAVYASIRTLRPGKQVKQPGLIDAGIFAHQVRVTPDNRLAILVTAATKAPPPRRKTRAR